LKDPPPNTHRAGLGWAGPGRARALGQSRGSQHGALLWDWASAPTLTFSALDQPRPCFTGKSLCALPAGASHTKILKRQSLPNGKRETNEKN